MKFQGICPTVLALVSQFGLACNDHTMIPIERAITGGITEVPVPLASNEIDVLVVIDNSASMLEEQRKLADNISILMEAIESTGADFNIAVITMDMATDHGIFRTAPGADPGLSVCDEGFTLAECPAVTGPVLHRSDYLDQGDSSGVLTPEALLRLQCDFACIAMAGTNGDHIEKGFDAVVEALSPDTLDTVNADFRRPDAWLAVLFVSDENDCSDSGSLTFDTGSDCEYLRDDLTPVSTYIDFLRSIPGTADGTKVLAAAIVGPDHGDRYDPPEDPRPSCSSVDTGEAYSGYRYIELVDAFGDNGTVANLCIDTFAAALDAMGRVIRSNLSLHCLDVPPPTCDSDRDCPYDATCGDPVYGVSTDLHVCSNFEIVIEVQDEETGEWIPYRGPLEDDPQFEVLWGTPSCNGGVGIQFTPEDEPGPGVACQIRYPMVLRSE